jgi:hypothetical protein
MRRTNKKQPQVVNRFLALADAMQGGVKSREAEAALRALMSWPKADKEELLFRTPNSFSSQKSRLIEFNNELILQRLGGKHLKKALLLVPFCLQHRSCPHHVAWNIDNCANCGRCAIGPLREVARKHAMVMRVAIRSMFAPMFVREVKPQAVVAIACEHELLCGLLRIHPIACYGILNARPEGLCKNTRVDLKQVEAAVKHLVNHVPARSRR